MHRIGALCLVSRSSSVHWLRSVGLSRVHVGRTHSPRGSQKNAWGPPSPCDYWTWPLSTGVEEKDNKIYISIKQSSDQEIFYLASFYLKNLEMEDLVDVILSSVAGGISTTITCQVKSVTFHRCQKGSLFCFPDLWNGNIECQSQPPNLTNSIVGACVHLCSSREHQTSLDLEEQALMDDSDAYGTQEA